MKKTIFFLMALTIGVMAWDKAVVVQPYGTEIDGDTFWMKKDTGKAFKVRLIGLDTFETKVNHRAFKQLQTLKDIHPKHLSQYKASIKSVLHFGYEAKRFTESHVLGKTVEYYDYGLDRYGRHLVYVKNLNYLLIRNGLAVQYPTNKMHQERKAFLLEASRKANLEQRGIYARGVK